MKDIKKDEIIFKIPTKLMINEKIIKHSDNVNNIVKQQLDLVNDNMNDFKYKYNNIIYIYNFILEKYKKNESIYKDMFKLYPTLEKLKENNIIFYKDYENIDNNSIIYKYIIDKKEKLNTVIKIIKNINIMINEDDIIFATLIYNNYSWSDGYIPFADLFNHNTEASCHTNDSINNILINYKDINEGEQIYITYGNDKSIIELALHYNFFNINNLNNVYLFMQLKSSNPFDFQKAKLLNNMGWTISIDKMNDIFAISNKIYIYKNTKIYDETNNLLKILSSDNEYELNNTNKIKYFNYLKHICKLDNDLLQYKIDNIKLPENYTYILNAFNERLNIIQENIDYCNRELQKLIL